MKTGRLVLLLIISCVLAAVAVGECVIDTIGTMIAGQDPTIIVQSTDKLKLKCFKQPLIYF